MISVMVRVSIRTSWVVNFTLCRCYRPVIYTRSIPAANGHLKSFCFQSQSSRAPPMVPPAACHNSILGIPFFGLRNQRITEIDYQGGKSENQRSSSNMATKTFVRIFVRIILPRHRHFRCLFTVTRQRVIMATFIKSDRAKPGHS